MTAGAGVTGRRGRAALGGIVCGLGLLLAAVGGAAGAQRAKTWYLAFGNATARSIRASWSMDPKRSS